MRPLLIAMNKTHFNFITTFFLLILVLPNFIFGQTTEELRKNFVSPPDDARIMMRWWWFGSSVTKPELEREMRLMKEGGIGGFEVQPVYALLPDDAGAGIKNLPYLSDEFLDMLKFTSQKSKELGMRMDLTLGSGWSFGGAKVPLSEAAGQLRVERIPITQTVRRVQMPPITVGEKLIAAYYIRMGGTEATEKDITEIKDIRDGAIWLPESPDPAGGQILVFISSHSGMQVKRPAVGGEGYVLNHLDTPSAENYLKNTGDRLMQGMGGNPPYSVFCDSLEVYNQDWTGDFLAEFQKRRGYDLKPYLPALVMNIGEKTADVRYDWGRTITELFNDRFMKAMVDWSRRNKTKFRIQGYGLPPASLSSNATADISDGEGAQWKVVRASRWASSANHIYGRPITSSETWTWLHSPVFRATPLDIKAEADIHFLQGINQLIGHGWPYTSEGVEYPGWRFYAAGVYNEKNPWWIVMPDLAKYLQRVSYLMRQGKPANDVALYLPNSDAYAHFTAGRVHLIDVERELVGETLMPEIFKAGYNLDFIDDDSLKQVGKIEKDHLVMGDGKYRIVVLPGIERIPPATLRKFDEFVKNGGILVATRKLPAIAPGVKATAAEQQEIKSTVSRLFEGANAAAKFVPDEKNIGAVLNSSFPADVALPESMKDVGFVRRKTAAGDIYFLANTSNMSVVGDVVFRASNGVPEILDPVTGDHYPAFAEKGKTGGTSVSIGLAPYGSQVIYFSNSAQPEGKLEAAQISLDSIDLSEDWKVTLGQDQPVTMQTLRSWTELEGKQFYSGTAAYEKTLSLTDSAVKQLSSAVLNFGEGKAVPEQRTRNGMQTWYDPPIREAAVIYVNDKRAGSLWCPPYVLDISEFLKPGENKIRVVVGNTALNYMAGRKLPDYKLLNLRYGERFQAQDMDKIAVLPSGLLGKVQLDTVSTR